MWGIFFWADRPPDDSCFLPEGFRIFPAMPDLKELCSKLLTKPRHGLAMGRDVNRSGILDVHYAWTKRIAGQVHLIY